MPPREDLPVSTVERHDLLIIGGGLAGAALALALRESGRRVAVFDARPAGATTGADADPRAYAISPAAAALLDEIGVWRHLGPTDLQPVSAMDIRGDLGARLRFTAYEARAEALAWLVEAGRLENELRETARRQAQVRWIAGAKPVGIERHETEVTIQLADGRRHAAPLVVGADGRDSWLRDAAGIACAASDYGEQGIAACYACETPHGDTARQWFLRDGVLAWLPLAGQRISIVWSTPDAQAERLLALDPQALALRVAAAGDHALGRLTAIGPARAFPLRITRVPDPIAERIALVGDAAHAIHPLSGHGINLGLIDARELAAAIASCPPGTDIGDGRILRRYRRARAEEVRVLQEATHGLRRLFAAEAPGLPALRNLGLALTDRLPRVKSLLARYAMG